MSDEMDHDLEPESEDSLPLGGLRSEQPGNESLLTEPSLTSEDPGSPPPAPDAIPDENRGN